MRHITCLCSLQYTLEITPISVCIILCIILSAGYAGLMMWLYHGLFRQGAGDTEVVPVTCDDN